MTSSALGTVVGMAVLLLGLGGPASRLKGGPPPQGQELFQNTLRFSHSFGPVKAVRLKALD